MDQINQNEKTIVFCATQDHALAVRDLINQTKTSTDPGYCERVTADDGALGDLERHVVERVQPAEVHRHVLDRQKGVAHTR